MPLLLVQLTLLLTCAGALVALIRKGPQVGSFLRTFFLEPQSPINLGVARVIAFALLAHKLRVSGAEWYVALPKSLRTFPYGWEWLAELMPFEPASVHAIRLVALIASVAALAGLFTRVTAPLGALLGIYVLGLPSFYLKVNHGDHMLAAALLMLCASPCSDALSLDAVIRRARKLPPFGPSAAYRVPLRAFWVMLGCFYFFAGLWKVWSAGDQWLSGFRLEMDLLVRWSEAPGFSPPFELTKYPLLLSFLGASTLLFELSFIFLLLRPVTRRIAMLAGLAFHGGIYAFMGINFLPVALFGYSLLIDWEGVARWLAERARSIPALSTILGGRPGRTEQVPSATRSAAGPIALCALVVLTQLHVGFARKLTWPISEPPTFGGRVTRMTSTQRLEPVVVSADGDERPVAGKLVSRLGDARFIRLLRTTAKTRGPARERYAQMLGTLFRKNGVDLSPGDALVLYEVRVPLGTPNKANAARKKPLFSLTMGPDGRLGSAAVKPRAPAPLADVARQPAATKSAEGPEDDGKDGDAPEDEESADSPSE